MPGLPQQSMAARRRYVKDVEERHGNADAEALRRVARRAVLCYAAAQATREMIGILPMPMGTIRRPYSYTVLQMIVSRTR